MKLCSKLGGWYTGWMKPNENLNSQSARTYWVTLPNDIKLSWKDKI